MFTGVYLFSGETEKGGVTSVLQLLVNSLDYADSDDSDSDVGERGGACSH